VETPLKERDKKKRWQKWHGKNKLKNNILNGDSNGVKTAKKRKLDGKGKNRNGVNLDV